MALRTVPIHRSGTRENLFMGGDREVTMFLSVCCFGLGFLGQTILSTGFSLTLWLVGLYLVRKAAKYDPKLRHVYLRHVLYKRYYPARSTPFRENTKAQGAQYK